jgi:hypothetical protein
MRCFLQFLAAIALLVLIGIGGMYGVNRYVQHKLDPDAITIANASLQGLREQNRLSAFAARFVAVVTTKQSQLGLSTQKTLVMPGMVRYEVDLAKLEQRDVEWDDATKTLTVTLPPVEADSPQIDMTQIREYGDNGLLARFTDAEKTMDSANRAAAQQELIKQARDPMPLGLARDATRRAVERSFAMPLRAAGIDAKVTVRFADEARPSTERWDTSRSLDEVMGNER